MKFVITKKADSRLITRMQIHYSKPKGFVGRSICYAIMWDNIYYGHIVAGSATRYLPNRNEFFDIDSSMLNNIVNNVFFNVRPFKGKYPCRNFTSLCVQYFVEIVQIDWYIKYKDRVLGFETLVEKPRTGELYRRAGWQLIGETKGYTCKRIGGESTEKWGGRRVWDTKNLKPKLVFGYKVT